MKNIKFMTSILLLSATTMMATHAIAGGGGGGKNCNVKVKSCLNSTYNAVNFRIYNGNDGSHAVDYHLNNGVSHGTVWSTNCAWDNCDIEMDYAGRTASKTDYCGDITIRRVSATNANVEVVNGVQACRY